MYRFLCLAMGCLFFVVSLRANEFKVVASASMIADMARQVAGEYVEVGCIVPVGADPHMHEPTPADAQLVAGAELIFMNGLTFEGWLNELIENSGTKAEVVTVTKGVRPIESDQYKNSTDPHAWMDVSLALVYIENIKEALVRFDAANKVGYERNYAAYRAELEGLDAYILEQVGKIPAGRRTLITSHDAFGYYGRRYGLRLEAVLGTSTDAEAQTSDIMRLSKIIKSKGIPAVFIESTVNPKLLKQLASDHDIKVGGELYADSIGDEQSPAPSYAAMMRYNTDKIVAALTRTVGDSNTAAAGEVPGEGGQFWLYGIIGLLFVGSFLLAYRKLSN